VIFGLMDTNRKYSYGFLLRGVKSNLKKPNILLIPVDDFRPELGVYE
tara:strand:+ start:472 stop:612 length:141 start_codon:yes stop_codon:yes gene_type:complete